MKLNCDLGESFGNWPLGKDEEVMPYIDMANIACGFHASDPDVMAKTIQLALDHQVQIGAHPGYDDKKGFGRRSIPHSYNEIKNLVMYQIGAMEGMCKLYGGVVSYVKPHGALYNDMMANEQVYRAIVEAISQSNVHLPLMILARVDNSAYQKIAQENGVDLLYEAFADRAYDEHGYLVSRQVEGSVYHEENKIIAQVIQLVKKGSVQTLAGDEIALQADTICVHGDNDKSIAVIARLRKELESHLS
ncbi:MAG: 5-oxoprolinase subunit PxpA [Vibrio sp.]